MQRDTRHEGKLTAGLLAQHKAQQAYDTTQRQATVFKYFAPGYIRPTVVPATAGPRGSTIRKIPPMMDEREVLLPLGPDTATAWPLRATAFYSSSNHGQVTRLL